MSRPGPDSTDLSTRFVGADEMRIVCCQWEFVPFATAVHSCSHSVVQTRSFYKLFALWARACVSHCQTVMWFMNLPSNVPDDIWRQHSVTADPMTLPGDCFDIHVQLHDLQTCSLSFSAWFLGSLIALPLQNEYGGVCKKSWSRRHILFQKKATIALLAVSFWWRGFKVEWTVRSRNTVCQNRMKCVGFIYTRAALIPWLQLQFSLELSYFPSVLLTAKATVYSFTLICSLIMFNIVWLVLQCGHFVTICSWSWCPINMLPIRLYVYFLDL